MICGARRHYGRGICRSHALKGRRRCLRHGGKAWGSPIGAWRNLGPAWAKRRARQELYKAMGISWPGGNRKPAKVTTMAEQAKTNLNHAIAELEQHLPADVRSMPIDELTAPQALGRASLVGLHQLVRIVEMPLDPDNLKQLRLIGDMALGANKLLQKHAQGERNHDLIGKLLAAIEAEKEGK